jgi:hypothetical protein
MERECRRDLLSQGHDCKIESCACGAVHITVGPVTFRASEDIVFDFLATLTRGRRRTIR